MNAPADLVRLDMDWLRMGEPLPVALHDRAGQLLAPRGTVIRDARSWKMLTERELFVPPQEYTAARRAFLARLQSQLRSNTALADIAETRLAAREVVLPGDAAADADGIRELPPVDPVGDVLRLQVHMNNTLRSPLAEDFRGRLTRDCRDLTRLLDGDTDGVFLVLHHDVNREMRSYAVHHSLVVAALCDRAARVMGWPLDTRQCLMSAALTMNISMLNLQDQLQSQSAPLSPAQREAVENHPMQSVELLRQAGVTDPVWLEAVAHHRGVRPRPFSEMSVPLRLARLIQRCDHFYARLSPRAGRLALSAAAAARTAFLGEDGMPDESGAAMLKVLGLYPPGTLVRLANDEIGMVLGRGDRPGEPLVVALLAADGMPMAAPRLRDTRTVHLRVRASIAPSDVRVRVDLQQLLALRRGRG